MIRLIEPLQFFVNLVIKYELSYQVNHNVGIHQGITIRKNYMSHISCISIEIQKLRLIHYIFHHPGMTTDGKMQLDRKYLSFI